MRHLAILAFICGLASLSSSAARASSLLPQSLHVDVAVIADAAVLVDRLHLVGPLPLAPFTDALAWSAPPSIPAHYAWVERDTRAFWYAAGAGAVTTLGTHVLAGIPTLALAGNVISLMLANGGLVGALAATAGFFMAYSAAEAALSTLVAMLVFDGLSDTYESHFMSGFAGHLVGAIASTAVTTLTLGGGMLLFHGVGLLRDFTGGAGFQSLSVFSLLGAMPAVVIAGIALIAVPALATAWALSAGASAKPGFAIDEHWASPTVSERLEDPSHARTVGLVPVRMSLSVRLPSL